MNMGTRFFEHEGSTAVCRLFAGCYQTSVHKGAPAHGNPTSWQLDALRQVAPRFLLTLASTSTRCTQRRRSKLVQTAALQH